MAVRNRGTITLPTVVVGGNTTSPLAQLSNQVQVQTDNPPRLGLTRKLRNIAANVVCQANYQNLSSTTTTGNNSNILPTFSVFKNGNMVFSSSAQIQMGTVVIIAPGNLFENQTFYGIYSDFVNPIEMVSGDLLSIQLGIAGAEIVNAGFGLVFMQATLELLAAGTLLPSGMGGYISYTDEDDL